MALPTNLKNSLDRLYDTLILGNVDDNTLVYEKINVAGKLFKIKISKETIDEKLTFLIEIVEK